MSWVERGARCVNPSCQSLIYGGFSVGGRCNRCHQWHRKHGYERPRHVKYEKARTSTRLCDTCKGQHYAKGMCRACYYYHRKHGVPRPQDLWRPDCKICKRPFVLEIGTGTPAGWSARRTKGRCHACYSYLRNHGEDRPKEVILAYAPLGWCDCGKPAIEVVQFKTVAGITTHGGGSSHTVGLCEIHLAEWKEYEPDTAV